MTRNPSWNWLDKNSTYVPWQKAWRRGLSKVGKSVGQNASFYSTILPLFSIYVFRALKRYGHAWWHLQKCQCPAVGETVSSCVPTDSPALFNRPNLPCKGELDPHDYLGNLPLVMERVIFCEQRMMRNGCRVAIVWPRKLLVCLWELVRNALLVLKAAARDFSLHCSFWDSA